MQFLSRYILIAVERRVGYSTFEGVFVMLWVEEGGKSADSECAKHFFCLLSQNNIELHLIEKEPFENKRHGTDWKLLSREGQ